MAFYRWINYGAPNRECYKSIDGTDKDKEKEK
jgi:hypothetical protein